MRNTNFRVHELGGLLLKWILLYIMWILVPNWWRSLKWNIIARMFVNRGSTVLYFPESASSIAYMDNLGLLCLHLFILWCHIVRKLFNRGGLYSHVLHNDPEVLNLIIMNTSHPHWTKNKIVDGSAWSISYSVDLIRLVHME